MMAPGNNGPKWWQLVPLATAVLAIIFTGISIWMSNQHFEFSERAWVVINDIEFACLNSSPLKEPEKFMCDKPVAKKSQPMTTSEFSFRYVAHVQNSGNGVARDGLIHAVVVDEVEAIWPQYFAAICSRLEEGSERDQKRLKQIDSYSLGFMLARGAELKVQALDTKTGDDVASSHPSHLSLEDPKDRKETRFLVLGCMEYKDQFNKLRHTRFCFTPKTDLPNPDKTKPIHFRHCQFAESAD